MRTLSIPFLAILLVVALSGREAGAQGVSEIIEYAGVAACPGGPVFITLAVEPSGGRISLAETPGAPPFAVGYSHLGERPVSGVPGYHPSIAIRIWEFRPHDLQSRIAIGRSAALVAADDGEAFSLHGVEGCGEITLRALTPEDSAGGVASIEQLPRRFTGTIGCHGSKGQPASDKLTLFIGDDSKGGALDGRVSISGGGPGDGGSHTVFGKFDPASGTLIVLGDRWIDEDPAIADLVSFEARLLSAGTRLVGTTSGAGCNVVSLTARDGTDAAPPAPASRSPLLWDTPAACTSFVRWADQVTEETGGRRPYASMPKEVMMEIGVGLFSNARFVPYFGKPFAELTGEERARVLDLLETCRGLRAYNQDLMASGAYTYIGELFPDRAADRWLDFRRYALLRERLSREMAALAGRTVGEEAIDELGTIREEMDVRFSDLWSTDRAFAHDLVAAKLEDAFGSLAQRLSDEIAALPDSLEAFAEAPRIERDMTLLAEAGAAEAQRVREELGARLREAADAAMGDVAQRAADLDADLAGLSGLSRMLDPTAEIIAARVTASGYGVDALRREASRLVEGARPDFAAQIVSMIDEGAGFEERARQYVSVVRFANRTIPGARVIADVVAPLHDDVAALRPVPRLADLVAEDGSPTPFGLKLAIVDYVDGVWAAGSALLPFSAEAFGGMVEVAAVDLIECEPAGGVGFWCQYDIMLSGSPILRQLFSGLSGRVRIDLSNGRWQVAELPANPARGEALARSYEEADRSMRNYQETFNQITIQGMMP